MPEGFVTHYSTVEGFSDYIAAKTEAAFSESFKKIDDYSDKDGTRTQVFQKRGGPKEAESLIPNQPEVLIHN